MKRLLIVEDEWIIRKSLLQLPWANIGIEEVLEAKDGQEGFDMAMRFYPEVILTDINMPFKNGIEMAKEVLTHQDCQVIFLTGYSDFNYAKEAIQLRAFDYILKPVDAEVLLPQVKNAFSLIEEEQSRRHAMIKMKKQLLLNQLFFSEDKPSEAQLMAAFAPSIDACFIFLSQRLPNKQWAPLMDYLLVLEDGSLFGIVDDSEQALHLLNDACFQSQLLQENQILIKTRIDKEKNLSTNLLEFWRQTMPFYLQKKGLAVDVPFPIVDLIKDEGIQQIIYQFSEYVKQHDFLRLRQRLSKFEEECLMHDWAAFQVRPVLVRFFFLISNEVKLAQEQFYHMYNQLLEEETIGHSFSFINRMITQWEEDQVTNQSCSLVEQAVIYINQNYADETLSLQKTADFLGVSHPYLSYLFKQELEKNYTEYVFERRMLAAKEMLETTQKNITEIALESGFSNSNYFSSCFKKRYQMTPKQYRESQKKKFK